MKIQTDDVRKAARRVYQQTLSWQGWGLQQALLLQRRFQPKARGRERFVPTSYGLVRVLEYGFDSPEPQPLFVDFHGGGIVIYTADQDDCVNTFLARRCNIKVVSIDYPKAPKARYPAPLEASYQVIQYYWNNAERLGVDRSCVGAGGYSAGGNLAAALQLMARERGDVAFAYQILVYPGLDMTIYSPERKGPGEAAPPKTAQLIRECCRALGGKASGGSVPRRVMEIFGACYYGGDPEKAKDPLISPLCAEPEQFRGQPPALVIVCGKDSLRADGVRYAARLREAGVSVRLLEFPAATHGFVIEDSHPVTRKARELMAEFISGLCKKEEQVICSGENHSMGKDGSV
ncbi:MAG: alpha/beta hydrolase [Oscillospiraceae bacterium]|jgi:acetyl esterase|nr:alpha/beta hydrolase [Oscillospiraceae bacterium]